MNCEASERSSDLDRENDNEIREFKREIEERFKLSIANKIYTFPKTIRTISDLVSSSESEDEPPEPALRPNGFPHANRRNFKKKSRSRLQESPPKELEKSYFTESVKKGKDKLKTTDSTNKRRDEDRRLDRPAKPDKPDRLDKTAPSKKEKERKKEKGRPEHDSAALLETIRSKMGRK